MQQPNKSTTEKRNEEIVKAMQDQAMHGGWTASGSMPGGNSLLTEEQYQESLGLTQQLPPKPKPKPKM